MTRRRIAWFSPLNTGHVPTPSVSAYVTDLVVPHLSSVFDIELFTDGFESYRDFPTHHYLSAFIRHREQPFDLFFYQLEDSLSSRFIRSHCGLTPGVVWFHDVMLLDDGPEPLYSSPWRVFRQAFRDPQSAEWPERSKRFEKEGPFCFREAGITPVALFSNERAHDEFIRCKEHLLEKARSYFVPFPAKIASSSPSGDFIVACSGTPRIEHRMHKLCAAISVLGDAVTLRWLIEESERGEAEAMIREFKLKQVELITGRSPEKWSSVVAGASVAAHLVFSVYARTSPYLEISLASGVPSMVTDFGGAEHLSDALVYKIRPGDTESTEIVALLKKVVSSKGVFTKGGVEFAQENLDPRRVAEELALVIAREADLLRDVMSRWTALGQEAQRALISEVRGLLVGAPDDQSLRHNQSGSASAWNTLVSPVFRELGWES